MTRPTCGTTPPNIELAHGVIVATRNRVDFEKAGVKVVDPFVEE